MGDTSATRGRDGDVRPPSEAVFEAVAAAESVDPGDLDESLYEVVDPDALDALFAGRGTEAGRVSFTYNGYEVTVTSGGRVRLDCAGDPAPGR